MNFIQDAQAHEAGTPDTSGGIQALMHINPDDHPYVGQPAQFYFAFTDPDKLFKIQNCDCKIFLFKGQDIIDQHQVDFPATGEPTISTNPLYTYNFTQPGDYSIHFSGQPKPGTDFDVFALHYDLHVYENAQAASAANIKDNTSNSNAADHSDHSEHTGHTEQGWQHLLSAHHLGHAIIFGGGLLAAIILFFYGLKEKRKRSKLK